MPSPSHLLEQAERDHRAGRLAEAEAGYRRLLDHAATTPEAATALTNLGVLALERGDIAAALALHRRALAQAPDLAPAWCNLGDALSQARRAEEAEAAFARAIDLAPDLAAAWFNRGNALLGLGRATEAEACYRRCRTLLPGMALVPLLLGQALAAQDRAQEAEGAFAEAITLDPGLAHAHLGCGNALYAQGRVGEATVCFRRAVELRPDLREAGANYLNCLHYLPELDGDAVARAHRAIATLLPAPPSVPHGNDRDPGRRLRIGYVSADLARHPLGLLLRPVMAAHDKSAVFIACYSSRLTGDEVTADIRLHADLWREVATQDDQALAARIRADAIDILVDLDGHTAGNRLGVFALKPAPLQVSWLGYPFSTGLAAMDYALLDRATVPPESEAWFSETVAVLPGSRFGYVGPESPDPAPPPMPAKGHVTFGSFNNIAKLNDGVIAAWSRILASVPGSRLLLKWPHLANAATATAIRSRFAAAGLSPERLELRGDSPPLGLMAEYGDMDIALDPFPYSGAFTTCEALWMGVPVLTLAGPRPFSRQSLALLAALGLEADLATTDIESYCARAATLAADAAALIRLRAELRPLMRRRLGQPVAFTRRLEQFYRDIWSSRCRTIGVA